MSENLNKDAFRIRRGLTTLSGNRLASLIQSSNYQKILRAYRKKYVVRKKDNKTGELYWFDKKTDKRVTEQDIHNNVVTNVTGSKTPIKDLKYISAKQSAQLESKLGALDDGVSVRDILFNVRKQFSPKVYDENSGEFIGRETEIKRDQRAALMLQNAENLKPGTTYARQEDQESLNKLSSLVKGQKAITEATGGSQEAQANANDVYRANSDDPKGALPFPTNLEGTWVGDKFIPSGTNFSQTPSKEDAKFQPNVESLTGGKAGEAVTKKSYEEILNMKRGKERDKLTIKHWEEQGYNFKGLRTSEMRKLANELRIGHAREFTGTDGKAIHFNPMGSRGSGRVFKRTET